MKKLQIGCLVLTLAIVPFVQNTILSPISECLQNCYQCDSKNIFQCSFGIKNNCFKGFQKNDRGACIVNKSNYKQDYFRQEKSHQKNNFKASYTCNLETKLGTKAYVNISGSSASQFSRKFSLEIKLEEAQEEIDIYFDIIHDKFVIINEYIMVNLLINEETVKFDEFSMSFRQKQFFPLSCKSTGENSQNINMKVSKFHYQYKDQSKIQKVQLDFSGFMLDTFWAIESTKAVYECDNCYLSEATKQPEKTTKEPKEEPNEQKKEQQKNDQNEEQSYQRPMNPQDHENPTDSIPQTIPSFYQEGIFFIEKMNMKQECKVSIFPRNQIEKLDINRLSIEMTCPRSENIDRVRIGIDQLTPYQQKVQKFRKVGNKIFVDVNIEQEFTSGVLQIYSVKPSTIVSQLQNLSTILQNPITPTQEIIMNAQLIKQFPINRYDIMPQQDAQLILNFIVFFSFAAWLSILGMITSIFFNKGYIWEEFLIGNQILFLFVYIFTEYLPLTLKESFSGLFRIENLNYFMSPLAENIEKYLTDGVIQESPLRYTAYKQDINFTRAFYPIILINSLFVAWLLIILLIDFFFRAQGTTGFKKTLISFAKKISKGKMNYIDQIWRFQFLTTLWSCFRQFYNFQYPENASNTGELNSILCLFCFFGTMSWPVIFFLYARKQVQQAIPGEIPLVYKNLLFLKNPTKSSEIQSEIQPVAHLQFHHILYPLLRYVKLLIFAICCSFLGQLPIFSLFGISTMMVLEVIYIVHHKIIADKVYLATRIIQNGLFVIISILMMIIYAASALTSRDNYFSLGYAVVSIGILVIFNGMFRTGYMIFLKTQYCFKKIDDLQSEQGSDFIKAPGTERDARE